MTWWGSVIVPCSPGKAEGWMRKFLTIVAIVVVVALFIAGLVGLYLLGGDDQSALEKLRDITIFLMGLLWIIGVLLLAAMAGIMAWVALTIKNRLLPMLETILSTATDTASRVKGTTEFLTEEVAAPVISVYGTIAKARAMTRTVTGRDRGSERKTISKLLKR